jgi:hypothetical protein
MSARLDEIAYKQTSIGRNSKVPLAVDQADFRTFQAGPVLPGMEYGLASHRRLAEHGERGATAVKCFDESCQHPLGNIEVALAGNRIESRVVLEVGFLWQV